MKIKMKAFFGCWLLLLGAGYAQITAPSGNTAGGACSVAGGVTQCNAPNTATMNVQVGDTIIAIAAGNSPSTPLLGGANACISTWPTPTRYNANSVYMNIWIIDHATTAVSGCTTNASNLTGSAAFGIQIYRGVGTVGPVSADATSVANSLNMFAPWIVPTAVDSLAVGMFFALASATFTTATGNGTIRRNSSGNPTTVVIADIPSTTIGQQVRTVVASSVSQPQYMRAAVELVPVLKSRQALLTDAMQSVLMNAPRSMDYVLPAAGLSNTWCTWFMPIGSAAHDYKLAPESTVQLNGQTSSLEIPSWQMTRICQDAQGHFWASPPLLAGTGISITPAPTGLTISSTGTPGVSGMTYIAGGTTTIPGTVAVPADTCQTIFTTDHGTTPNADGVQQSDVVSFSLQPSASGWNNGKTFFHPIAYAGSVSWRACNTDTTSYTPSQRDVNWYVARPSAGGFGARQRAAHKKVARPTK